MTSDRCRGLGSSPIVNLHVVYDRRVLEHEFAAGVGTPVQYVFDRTDSSGLERGQYLAVSLSAADARCRHRRRGAARRGSPPRSPSCCRPRASASVERFVVTREHAATFRAAPGAGRLRPAPRTGLPGLALAGAWTDTGWPATMEGAVRSGHAAARVALAALEKERTLSRVRGMRTGMLVSPHDAAAATDAAAAADRIVLVAPMRLEARALRARGPASATVRPGRHRPSPRAPQRRAALAATGRRCGRRLLRALSPSCEPGDIVVATELLRARRDGRATCPGAAILAGVLRRGGLRVHVGPIVSVRSRRRRRASARRLRAPARSRSTWSRPGWPPAARGRPLAVAAGRARHRRARAAPPAARRVAGRAARYRALRAAPRAAAREWAHAIAPREVVLAAPRASCAGVERAIEIVERALERRRAGLRAQADRPQRPRRRRPRARAARCSSTSSTRCPTARRSSSPPTASRPQVREQAAAQRSST